MLPAWLASALAEAQALFPWVLAAALALGWFNQNRWLGVLTMRLLRFLQRICPGQRLVEKMVEIEHRLEMLGDHVALAVARGEAMHHCPAVLTTDQQGACLWASEAFLTMVGLPFSGVSGSNWINAIHQDDRGEVIAAWRRAVEARDGFSYDFRYWSWEREEVTWVSASARHVRNPLTSRIAGWVAEVRPIEGRPAWKLAGKQPPRGHKDCRVSNNPFAID